MFAWVSQCPGLKVDQAPLEACGPTSVGKKVINTILKFVQMQER